MRFLPWWWVSPEAAHRYFPKMLHWVSRFRDYHQFSWEPLTWQGIEFDNPLGLAGGVDKDAVYVGDWWTWGAGFLEVGTVTPKPQGAHPPPNVMRSREGQSLWNHLGFPSEGGEVVHERLKALPSPYPAPLFLNIGPNRDSEDAVSDYVHLVRLLQKQADAFVVNISSPNTKGLKDLLEPQTFLRLLRSLQIALGEYEVRRVPLLIKLGPDLSEKEFKTILDLGVENGVNGWVLTNSTTERTKVSPYPKDGGVSGQPLSELSKRALFWASQHLGSASSIESDERQLIVSVGGALTPESVFERLDMGAHLVEVYTALIFQGPWFFGQVAKQAKLHYDIKRVHAMQRNASMEDKATEIIETKGGET